MKKSALLLAVLLMLLWTACARQDKTSAGAGNAEHTQPESMTMPAEGEWPANAYTEGLPVPPGTVSWAMLDAEHGNCSVSVADMDESAFRDYMELLRQEGFSELDNASEKIAGQDYVSVGTLLTNDEKWLSISYIPGNFTIYISFVE